METPKTICAHCGRMVDKIHRFAIMVDGDLQISVPLCPYPCYENALDAVMPHLHRKEPSNAF